MAADNQADWDELSADQKNGAVLRIRRMKAGLTQVALGQLVGVSCATISRWELGDQYPPTTVELRNVYSILAGFPAKGTQ
jgi:transcriptional regulator with XRE-family HTH domain